MLSFVQDAIDKYFDKFEVRLLHCARSGAPPLLPSVHAAFAALAIHSSTVSKTRSTYRRTCPLQGTQCVDPRHRLTLRLLPLTPVLRTHADCTSSPPFTTQPINPPTDTEEAELDAEIVRLQHELRAVGGSAPLLILSPARFARIPRFPLSSSCIPAGAGHGEAP